MQDGCTSLDLSTEWTPEAALAAGGSGRRLLVMRHGERCDFTFNSGGHSWLSRAVDERGVYRRFNVNLPRSLPKRSDGIGAYAADSPLTEIGYLQAKLMGRALRDAGVTLNAVYSSPSLRCAQTTVGVLRGMGNTSLSFQVEPGLFEWGAWCRSKRPSWLPAAEFRDAFGFPANCAYQPIVAETQIRPDESLRDYYERSFAVTRAILRSHSQDGTVLLVAHGASLDTLTRQLCGGAARSQQDFFDALHETPYVAMAAAVEQRDHAAWTLTEPPVLPLQHQANSSYNWHAHTPNPPPL